MVDDTYYITPHEAALAVVATSMKKSRLPLHILIINSTIGGFLFTAGGMLYIMCESTGKGLIDNGAGIIVGLAQGAVFAIGLFYVIVCGMELFNSNILFFTTGVMRGAVTLMDLFISWFVSFWVNLASTIFVVYLFGHLSKVFQQPNFIVGTISIAESKNSYSFMETFLKGVAGNFFVCLAVYLQIMVKPLHVKLAMIFLPIFTFVALGFTHAVADMTLVPAGIFNNCGYGFGHYFWKIMLPGTLGNIVGGSFFGIVIPWYLHLVVIENDMKRLKLPVYDERDEQPALNMDSRVVRVASASDISQEEKDSQSIQEFKPDIDNSISRQSTRFSALSANSLKSRIRSPKGVFPVAGMGAPLEREETIANANTRYDDLTSINSQISNTGFDNSNETTGADKVGDRLIRAITKSVTRTPVADIEMGNRDNITNSVSKNVAKANKAGSKIDRESSTTKDRLLHHFSFGGGGDDHREIHRRLSEAKITRKAAALSNDIAGIHTSTVDWGTHSKKNSKLDNNKFDKGETKQRIGNKDNRDRWKHFVYDYELDGERPVSFISEEVDPLSDDNNDDAASSKSSITNRDRPIASIADDQISVHSKRCKPTISVGTDDDDGDGDDSVIASAQNYQEDEKK